MKVGQGSVENQGPHATKTTQGWGARLSQCRRATAQSLCAPTSFLILHTPLLIHSHGKVPLLAFSQVRDDRAVARTQAGPSAFLLEVPVGTGSYGLRRNGGLGQIRRMIEEMTYISEHLTSLRQEITELRDLNTRYSAMSEHGPLDQSALEVRANRLLQIKQELSGMLERPNDPKVWWDRVRKPAPTR